MNHYNRRDPWDESIDGVVLNLKDGLKDLCMEPTNKRPYSSWAQENFSAAREQNPSFTFFFPSTTDWERYTWTSISTNWTDWREDYQEKGADLKVYFDPVEITSRGGSIHMQYIRLFIYGKEHGHRLPMLRIQRKLPTRQDLWELKVRYIFPSWKPLFDFLRG